MGNEIIDKNLSAIRRIDPFADILVSKASHVTLFDFNEDGNKWVKTGTEGPLFVYRRIDVPKFSLIIANRHSLTNFVEPITEALTLSYQPPYIFLYRPEDECKKLFDLLILLIESYKDESKLDNLPLNDDFSTNAEQIDSGIRGPQCVTTVKRDHMPKPNRMQSIPGNASKSLKNLGNGKSKPHKSSQVQTHPRYKDERENDTHKLMVPTNSKELANKSFVSSDDSYKTPPTENTKKIKIRSTNLAKTGSEEEASKENIASFKTDTPKQVLDKLNRKSVPPKESVIEACEKNVSETREKNIDTLAKVTSTEFVQNTPLILSKEQFLHAFQYLLNNDPGFSDELHQAYIKTISSGKTTN